ncbi:hypothetical protein [Streptosporangium roseum]|uniref:hypothetical protein n=1 Tax=Streptosporangium roseum TaxID=2001 RepID=UPI0033295B7E
MDILSPGALKLSVSVSTGAKIGALFSAIFFIGISLFMILKIERADGLFTGGFQIFLLPPVVVMAVSLISLLGLFRFRAGLQGSVLEVRGAFTRRKVDLARARVWLDSFPERSRARDRGLTGRRTRHLYLFAQEQGASKVLLRLRAARGFLPPHELTALADAIESGYRPSPEAAQAAALLRRLATDPTVRIP